MLHLCALDSIHAELCSSILRKRITQCKSNTSNFTNHFYSVCSLSLHLCVFFYLSGFIFTPFIFQLFGSAAPAPLCQRNKLSVCQISVQRLRLNQYRNYAYINIMHALFAFIQFIHSIPFIITVVHIFSHCKQKCSRTQRVYFMNYLFLWSKTTKKIENLRVML